MARLLVIEDDPEIGANVCDFLRQRGHDPDWAPDGYVGLALAASQAPELVVLDLNLPRMDGLTWCRRYREELDGRAPVIMLTARDALDDRLAGFGAGADDYLVKPFALAELAVRVEALLRRAQGRALGGVLRQGRLEIDRDARCVRVDGAPVRLPPKPYRLVELLADRAGKVFTHEELERAIWGDETFRSEALRTLVAATRRLFVQTGCGFDPIETLHGHGYRLRAR
ncbi:MAG: response regulator transcription factor [Burkholderiaceae bacterium]|nr:response regulator transcription factor [Burkholderiaceae bacterium]MEB2349826.1 response regulator transcription factor [Burkholderiaceae bacterium]